MTLTYQYEKVAAKEITPIQVFHNVKAPKKFLLESTYSHPKKGKFSFVGMDPYEEIIGANGETTVIDLETGTRKMVQEHALHYLKKHMPAIETHLPVPFYGGAVGYVGYDVIRDFEDIGVPLPDELQMPDLHFMLFKHIIAFDHSEDSVYLIAVNPNQNNNAEMNEALKKMKKLLSVKTQMNREDSYPVNFEPDETEAMFKEKVKKAKEHIKRGDVFQVVLSQRMTAKVSEHPDFPFSFYQKLRKANPSPYMFYIDFEDYLILGASPESLVQTTGKEVVTNPIAGTRPRGSTTEEDHLLMEELLADEKEIAEHRMLVDLARNDLGSVCDIGSITIPTYMEVEKYQHVMHIVSEVKGILKQNLSGIDALIKCLPAGTVSGAPKIRAMQIINDLEEKKRGAYGGGIGYINFNHDLNMALTIRSLIIKEKVAYLQAGAGIVFDSVPESEYKETLNKAKSIMEVERLDLIN